MSANKASSSHGAVLLPMATLLLRGLVGLLCTASRRFVSVALAGLPEFVETCRPTFSSLEQHERTGEHVSWVAGVGCAYSLLAMAFVTFNVVQRKKMIGGSLRGTVFLISADVACSALVIARAAAALGFTVENEMRVEVFDLTNMGFYELVQISCLLLLMATVCMVVIIMLTVSLAK
ncbi:CASP-like protein 4D1 [Brachypodium distachyon]|uniref:CASP-like protein n=1 Tax=Brachypodium distachyon TaxID=15368 RepID=A0A2K2CN84_BRADI|nr:CASP-like protein 4D1 [Brachypodium distachyon]PNT63483.1 hypothetical protein BRADI_4g16581v3 [Brachypodium distachyon]|eukprot:XP_024310794.1 CASP-like protein 4D1 [Brachypodium distachyon]